MGSLSSPLALRLAVKPEIQANMLYRFWGGEITDERYALIRRYGDESPVYVYEAHLRGLMQRRGINDFWTAKRIWIEALGRPEGSRD
jgi:hypothetical protein